MGYVGKQKVMFGLMCVVGTSNVFVCVNVFSEISVTFQNQTYVLQKSDETSQQPEILENT